MTNNNQELNSLKSIHRIQVGGEIQNILKQLRNGKMIADSLSKKLSQLKTENVIVQKPKEEVFESISLSNVTKESEVKPIQKAEIAPNQNKFDRQKENKFMPRQQNNFRNRNNENYQKRVFDNNNNNTRKPFDNTRKPFERNFNQFNNNKPFERTNSNFQKSPFNNSKPFEKKFNRNQQTNNKYGFVQSKGNSVKVFAPLESSKVLLQPERTFGNKNKSQRNLDEKSTKVIKKQSKKNFILSTDDEYEEITMGSRKLIKNKKKAPTIIAPAIEHAIITTENITVKNLSEKIGKPAPEIIKKLMILGILATVNSSIDFTTASLVSSEIGVTLEQKLEKTAEEELTDFVAQDGEGDKDLITRAPVVAVMGHVDHGKTSLLDIIRKENVAQGEAGGITQRIGAYQVLSNGQKITFIDTPGHAAFTQMRARGAKITDIAILVVAADDGIMPQTIEAMNHIKSANIPMIVAVNKMDKKEANVERIKQQLSENGILIEEWGGDTILVPVSAKTGVGIDDLLNMIILVSQMQELKANPNKLATGVIIEASLDKGKGPIATMLVQNGTLHVGDTIMSGITYGKVKAMFDEYGNLVKEAGPSMPVSILGFNDVPQSGEHVYALDEKLSKQVIQERKNKIKQERADKTSGVSLDDFMNRVNEGKLKNLNLILKADVQGSVEALKSSLTALSNEEVKIVCVHCGAGAVTESDVLLAQASGAIIINFNLKLENKVKQMSQSEGVEIKNYKVIYEVVDDIMAISTGMKAKVYEKVVCGHAEVRVIFKLSSSGTIAGCYVLDGKIMRNCGAKVLRDNAEIADTTVEALKIQKDDKSEVAYSYECGVKLKDFVDFKEGDIIEAYQNVEVKK